MICLMWEGVFEASAKTTVKRLYANVQIHENRMVKRHNQEKHRVLRIQKSMATMTREVRITMLEDSHTKSLRLFVHQGQALLSGSSFFLQAESLLGELVVGIYLQQFFKIRCSRFEIVL